ncbi:MAG: ATP-binding protein, partial [Chloroflexi bacterium]|nr:ATP-binding protein [Chloroflexota bacterium]
IDGKRLASHAAGISLRLDRLIDIFGLSGFEKRVLLLALLPEAAPHSERLFGYIQDDVTRRRPVVALALDAFCSSNADKLDRRTAFLPDSALIKNGLIQLNDENSRKGSSLLSLSFRIDNRIANYLLGQDSADAALLPWVAFYKPAGMLSAPDKGGPLQEGLPEYLRNADNSNVCIFCGVGGINESNLIEAASRNIGTAVLAADFSLLLETYPDPVAAVNLLCREAKLTSSVIYGRHFDAVAAFKQSAKIIEQLEEFQGALMISGDNWNSLALPWNRRIPVPFTFNAPDYYQREIIWRSYNSPDMQITGDTVTAVTGKFQLNNNQIEKAVRLAMGLNWQQSGGQIPGETLFQACRMISATRLMEIARKINPRYRLSDIVLPPEPDEQLQDILDYVKYRHIVLDKWGFRQKSSLGKGLNILFSGPSGTGKTMAAEIIAGEMGLDLYKIDLSGVVSKYIGETEKNLDRVFKEAADSNCVLFFDEADALFGKRFQYRVPHSRTGIPVTHLAEIFSRWCPGCRRPGF